jgi:predicted DNA-binding transcriptional regulator
MVKKKIQRDRKVRKGIDYDKLSKIWRVMLESGDWLHIAEIARRSGINQVTVRYYLDKYLDPIVEETRIAPSIKLRLVKAKPNANLEGLISAKEAIEEIKTKPKLF